MLRGALPPCHTAWNLIKCNDKSFFAFDGNVGISVPFNNHIFLLRSDKKLWLTAIFIMEMLLMIMLRIIIRKWRVRSTYKQISAVLLLVD